MSEPPIAGGPTPPERSESTAADVPEPVIAVPGSPDAVTEPVDGMPEPVDPVPEPVDVVAEPLGLSTHPAPSPDPVELPASDTGPVVATEPEPGPGREPVLPPEPPDPTPAEFGGGPPPQGASRSALWVVSALAALLALVLGWLVAFGPMADKRAEDRVAKRRTEALAEARRLALALTSVDYKTIEADVKRVLDASTGKFREDFDKLAGSEAYQRLAKDQQAVLKGNVVRAALEECGDDPECRAGDEVSVLVYIDQTSTNKARQTPRIDRNRVVISLLRRGGRWLISDVRLV